MENLVSWFVTDYFYGLLDSLVDPKKRVSVIYLLTAILVAFSWSFLVKNKNRKKAFYQVVADLFSKKTIEFTELVSDLHYHIILHYHS